MIVLDYETMPIEPFRPAYPPQPVGVAIKWGDEPGRYFSGDEALAEVARAYSSSEPILFHNAKFDMHVAEEKHGMRPLGWRRTHDSMVMAFLNDPYAQKIDLKTLDARYCGGTNADVNEMHAWIMEHKGELEAAYPQYGRVTMKAVGAWIFAVPEEMRARYAIEDVERASRVFKYLAPRVRDQGMWGAYEREMKLMPTLIANERAGLHVATEQLGEDIERYREALIFTDEWVRMKLRAPELNLDADKDVIQALLSAGEVREHELPRTKPSKTHPNGQISANKEALHPDKFKSREIAFAIGYRSRLSTCLNTFMQPWYDQAVTWGGKISTHWHQTRGEGGTRTGRPSSSQHNFLNLPKTFEGRDDGYKHPDFLPLEKLPLCRKYIKADPGHVFLHRDFDGQELRVFAHFESGALLDQYLANPKIDVHQYVKEVADKLSGRELERTKVKILNFTALYGGGIPAMMERLRVSRASAVEFRNIHNKALPGRVILDEEIKRIIRSGGKIRTWGGRLYGLPPSPDNRDTSYMLINYLVQGSAADYTKDRINAWHARRGKDTRLLTTVYDEINISAPAEVAEREMATLKEVMNEPCGLTTPMLTKGKLGPTWGDLTNTGNGGYD